MRAVSLPLLLTCGRKRKKVVLKTALVGGQTGTYRRKCLLEAKAAVTTTLWFLSDIRACCANSNSGIAILIAFRYVLQALLTKPPDQLIPRYPCLACLLL